MSSEAGQGSSRQREQNAQRHRGVKAKGGFREWQSFQVCWRQRCMAGWAGCFDCPSGITCSPLHPAVCSGWVGQWEVPAGDQWVDGE